MTKNSTPELANKLIDALGGTTVVAEMCGIRPPSVSEWRNAGIPHPWMLYFSAAYPAVLRKCKRALMAETKAS